MRSRRIAAALVAAGWLLAMPAVAGLAAGPGNTPFWIGLSDPGQVDQQVSRMLAEHAVTIAVRLTDGGDGGRAVVARLKKAAPQTPVLMYAWASRNLRGRPGSAGIIDWLDRHPEWQINTGWGRALAGFPDVTNAAFQSRLAGSIAGAVARGGFDGVALDLAIRTPRYRPGPLARLCKADATFCRNYAAGMDATFDAIRGSLRGKAVLYNGIWNQGPGSVDDQLLLLAHADAAIVEFFGGDVKGDSRGFSQDVLPYLQAMAKVPDDKKLFVFGRASRQYDAYAEDYARQRYLYCAYLLGARKNTYFKYHATFQSGVPEGRSGGLSIYADWSTNLGAPSKAYTVQANIYSRPFAHGLVVVAPDDGSGGSFTLPRTMYSPEGDTYSGTVALRPGQGLLLLDAKPAEDNDQHLLDLRLASDWPAATLGGTAAAPVLDLQPAAAGAHDLLLDPIRTSRPRKLLRLGVRPTDAGAGIDLLVEVDDSERRSQWAMIHIGVKGAAGSGNGASAIGFRMRSPARAAMPLVSGPSVTAGNWQNLELDGAALLAKSGLTFRRWDFARFNGAIQVRAVTLAR